MTHQQLITTPDIDLMQLAESNPSDEILDELASRGAATVFEWLRSRCHSSHAVVCRFNSSLKQQGTNCFNFIQP